VQPVIRKLLLASVSGLLALLLMEGLARVWVGSFASDGNFKLYASEAQLKERFPPKVVPHRYLGFCLNPDYRSDQNRHNALGFRGDEVVLPKPEGEFRIVCLGGSTTYTLGVEDHRLSYPALLESLLVKSGFDQVKVINAGVPGYSSWENLMNFQFRVLDVEPDMLIVYNSVNDIHPRLVWPSSAYRGDNSGRRSPPEMGRPAHLGDFSTLARIYLVRQGLIAPLNAMANSLDVYPETYLAEEFQQQARRGRYPKGVFKRVSASQMLATNTPVYYRRNLENLVAIAEHTGVETILATFAHSARFKNRPTASSAEYVGAYEEMNAELASIAEESTAHLFDFAAVFPDNSKYFTDGRHVTEAGARLKAQLFAKYLRGSGILAKALQGRGL